MYIIAGLGNPGKKFEKTRHNMGYNAVDHLCERNGIDVGREKFQSVTGEGIISGQKVLIVKPLTFMNLSGHAVREAFAYYKVPHDHLIVLYDDIDIPLGNLRIRKSGGPGTHNGMRSVVQELGFKDFPRIRLGVGNDGGDLVNYVIGKVPKAEQEILDKTADSAAKAVEDILMYGLDKAMNMDNTRKNEK